MCAEINTLHYRRKIQELALLFNISRILDQSVDLKQAITPVIREIAGKMGMQRGIVSLMNRETGDLRIEAAYGLTPQQKKRGRYKAGEGIVGRVFKEAQPAIIPDIRENEEFLNRTGSRKETLNIPVAFLCVPIIMGSEPIGTLSVDRIVENGTNLEEDIRLLTIVASMIAQAAKLRQQFQEEKKRLLEENNRLQNQLKEQFRPSNIIGTSREMMDVYNQIGQVCRSDATVLILGESGTGKEMAANAIHYNSLRADKPFIKVNCAALPESIIESELFGHEKGAFTGADSTRKGRFELADGGTIFLDEIGDISQTVQIKLLRVLQEREIERVGSGKSIKIDVRLVAATNARLEEQIKTGTFREDLYYRLNIFPINMPPLRSRKTDIVQLADFFVEKYSKKHQKTILRISTSAIDLLTSYHWPGNVRELENSIERAVLLSTDQVIHANLLPPSLQSAESTDTFLHSTLDEAMEALEKELLLDALKSTNGNMAKAARNLSISERRMGLRVEKYHIDPKMHS